MIRQLAHTCFYSDDLHAMVEFYKERLGLPVQFTLQNRKGATMGYYFACGNSTFIEVFDRALALEEWGGHDGGSEPSRRYRHMCFEVLGLAGHVADLRARGVDVSAVTDGKDGSLQAWIKDPDGNDIELMEYTRASLQLGRPHSA